jgi:cysteinyl-tRNA synthetase
MSVSTKPVYLTNTLGKRKELFQPIVPGKAGIYSCGPTVYKDIHIGNLRTFVMTDVLRRVLEYNGYEVLLVRNITDVGHMLSDADSTSNITQDKMEQEAKLTGTSVWELASHYTEQYLQDVAAVNILPAHINPRATDYIPEMITLTERLLTKKLAYQVGGNVYYDVSAFPQYGKLTGRTIEQLRNQGQSRQDPEFAEDKQDIVDFALWKAGAGDREMNWESPWSTGFPGWHIECSAMATKYLGEQFDIHTGGIDISFPHHEDEIAQSEGVSGKNPVRYWVHGEMLNISQQLFQDEEPGEIDAEVKMSRSLGNVILLETLKEHNIEPLAYRYLLFTAHYRSKLRFTTASIKAAQHALENFREDIAALLSCSDDEIPHVFSLQAEQKQDAFHTAINNDMDMPTALSIAREVARDRVLSPSERYALLLDFDRVLGLDIATIRPPHTKEVTKEVQVLVKQRDQARIDKDWVLSDQLRDALVSLGFEVHDTPQGTEVV